MERNHYRNNKMELWSIIMQTSFAMDDIQLYLDTHPCDMEALKAYKDYKKIRLIAVEEYTRDYGPISAYDVNVENYWEWVNSPWPWEGVC